MKLERQEIIQQMEQLKEETLIRFALPEIFGGGVAAVGLNPGKGGKKYLLKLANSAAEAELASPYWESDKAKDIAKWVADRQGDKID
jgi:hypothetical protein